MATPTALIQLSKTLSYLLRHNPAQFGLQLDAQGWCEVEALLAAFAAQGAPLTRALLEEVVEKNDKQRFAFSADGTQIRASQGHSLEIDLDYAPETPPERLYHGTAERFLPAILKEGLQKRRRHHVHLSADVDTALRVGQRHGKPVVLMVLARAMRAAGHVFYRSANGVWLTEEVPPRFLQLLQDKK
ncbi:MAG: RNA 2'-phosphotransferase [Saprospiraceae bacterium]|nr:RNA 2'-phosphotransferase [Saprospiraceae bacterium]